MVTAFCVYTLQWMRQKGATATANINKKLKMYYKAATTTTINRSR